MTDLRLSRSLTLPIDVVGESTAILAKKGAGKSNTAKVIVEDSLAHFVLAYGAEGAPMAGNSVHFDRRWLQARMPRLEELFDYHNLDVSSLRFLCVTWGWTAAWSPHEDKPHRAMADLDRSIAELKFYREIIERRMA